MHIVYHLNIHDIEELYRVSEEARIPTTINFGKHKGTAIAELLKTIFNGYCAKTSWTFTYVKH